MAESWLICYVWLSFDKKSTTFFLGFLFVCLWSCSYNLDGRGTREQEGVGGWRLKVTENKGVDCKVETFASLFMEKNSAEREVKILCSPSHQKEVSFFFFFFK